MKQIYVYETDYSKSLIKEISGTTYTNFKKIGETSGDINGRIQDQFQGIPHWPEDLLYTVLYTTDATNIYGANFTDKDFHNYLIHMGYYNIPNSEWFSITLEEVISELNKFKNLKYPKHSYFGRNILNLLNTVGISMSVYDIANHFDKPTKYVQVEIQKLYKGGFLSRTKGRDSMLHIIVFLYSIKKSKCCNTDLNLPKRELKVLNTLGYTAEDVIKIIKDKTIKEGIESFSKLTGYTTSASEKLLSVIRKELERKGMIQYDINTGYRHTSKIIRQVL